jgi:hypothetical protein
MDRGETACPREGPHALTDHRVLTRSDVLEAERPSWAGRLWDESPEFYYDGVNFWRCAPHERELLFPRLTPEIGWWHRAGCRCPYCRARTGVA